MFLLARDKPLAFEPEREKWQNWLSNNLEDFANCQLVNLTKAWTHYLFRVSMRYGTTGTLFLFLILSKHWHYLALTWSDHADLPKNRRKRPFSPNRQSHKATQTWTNTVYWTDSSSLFQTHPVKSHTETHSPMSSIRSISVNFCASYPEEYVQNLTVRLR